MKHFFIIILTILILSTCKTIDNECRKENEMLKQEIIALRDSVNSIKLIPDTIFITKIDTVTVDTETGYKAKLQIERIKHYVNISEARPMNKKYFFGWVKRTVSE